MEPTRSPRRPGRMHHPRLLAVSLAAAVSVLAAGCGSGPSASPTPAPPATPDAAVAAVRAVTPLFDGVGPRNPDLVGQAAWWDATQVGGTWTVTISAGWGDCQAGCIDRHTWTWTVAADGAPAFAGEEGSPLTDQVIAALHGESKAQGVGGWVVAGPTCPVERPGDPACAPRNVDKATLTVQDAAGKQVAAVTTDASGLYRIALEPGSYTLTPAPVDGYMGTAPPVTFDVMAGAETWVPIAYDTGIR